MKLIDSFSLATRMFRTRAMRTLLTILGVSVGIGAVLFLVSLGYGLQNVILSQITTADSLLSLDVSSGSSEVLALDQSNIDNIASMEGVTEVSRQAVVTGQFTIGELTGDGLIYAVDPSFFRLHGTSAKYGELFIAEDQRQACVSSAGAQIFGYENPDDMINVQAKVTLYIKILTEENIEEVNMIVLAEPYNITCVIEDENTSFIYVPLATIDEGFINTFDMLKVKVVDNDHLLSIREEIIGHGFLVAALSDTIDQAIKIFRVVQIVLGFFGLIALIVSAIGMFNTMTISLLERINEIGIMRAIGVTKRDIKIMFLMESMIMGFLGGVFGVVVGWLGGEMANLGLNLLAKNFGGQSLDLFYEPFWFVVFIIIFSTIIGILTGIFPSRKAAKLNPLDALRYK